MQNPRSPAQQHDEIVRRIELLKYPWRIQKDYRDESLTGRLLRKRHGFQQMLTDIRSGAVVTDAILVDTLERFGRSDEVSHIRRQLYERYGVLVLTADTNFADPTTPQGQALGIVEGIRSTQDAAVKAHNVLRGQRDAATLKHWPAGKAPMGFML